MDPLPQNATQVWTSMSYPNINYITRTSVRDGACYYTLRIHVGDGPSFGKAKVSRDILSLEEAQRKGSVFNSPKVVVSVGKRIVIGSPT